MAISPIKVARGGKTAKKAANDPQYGKATKKGGKLLKFPKKTAGGGGG